MSRKRPVSVLVIAILALVLGLIGVAWELFQAGVGVMMFNTPRAPAPPPNQPASVFGAMQAVDANAPYWREANVVAPLAGLVIAVILSAAGIGLLLMQSWARWAAVVYAVLSILYQASWMAYTFLAILPTQMAYYDAASGPGGGPPPPGYMAGVKFGAGCSSIGLILGMAFPVAVVVVMLLPSVRAAFRGEPAGGEDFAGREDAYARRPAGYDEGPPGYGGEPDDRFGPRPG
jgi:hypothetical protein